MKLQTGGHETKSWTVIILLLIFGLCLRFVSANAVRDSDADQKTHMDTTRRSIPQLVAPVMEMSKVKNHAHINVNSVGTTSGRNQNSSKQRSTVESIPKKAISLSSHSPFSLKSSGSSSPSSSPGYKHSRRLNASRRNAPSSETSVESPTTSAVSSGKLNGERRSSDAYSVVTNISAVFSSLSIVEHESFGTEEYFCYLRGVCRLGDGTYLLPTWMEKHSAKITRCGMSNVIYSVFNTTTSSGKRVMGFKGLPRANINISDTYRDIDVVGADPPRAEQHLLISDLTPLILLSDMFLRPRAYQSVVKASCFTASGTCSSSRMYPKTPNSALLVDSTVSEVKEYLWPKGVVRLLRNGFGGSLQVIDLQDVYGWRFRSHASCFRSILVTNATLSSFKPSIMLSDNFLFRANHLSRIPVQKLMSPTKRRCDLKVLILNQFRKGRILGADILERAIEVLNKALFREYPNSSVRSENVYFQNSSFHEQVAVMQEADIVVAAHSDSNANLAFLRPGALFLELLPFGVKPDIFQSIANAYNVDYRYFHALPDAELFSKCIAHYNTEAEVESEVFLSHWNTAANTFLNATRKSRSNGQSKYYLPEEENDENNDMRNVRDCATWQRVSVNIRHLAKTIMREAFLQCGIRGEERQKAVFSQAMLV